MNPEHIRWCRQTFDMMAEGGVWGIPRSGLVFQRIGDKLVLKDAMPWSAEMPITADELEAMQLREFEETKEHFAAAGITVEEK